MKKDIRKLSRDLLVLAIFLPALLVFDYALPVFMATSPANGTMNGIISAEIRILSGYEVIGAGKAVNYEMTIINPGIMERMDVVIYISAINLDTGQERSFYRETVAIQNILAAARELKMPASAPPGRYRLQMEVIYRNRFVTAADTFEIRPAAKEVNPQFAYDYTTAAIIALIIIFAALLFRESRRLKNVKEKTKWKR